MAEFLSDHCIREPKERVLLKDLYAAYLEWLKQSGITAVQPSTKVKLYLEQQGFVTKKRAQGVTILGLGLRDADT